MRIIVTYAIPIDKGNELVRSGEIGNVLQSIVEEHRPEAAYFYPNDAGERAGALVVEMQEGTDLPKIAEALFLGLDARVSVSDSMNTAVDNAAKWDNLGAAYVGVNTMKAGFTSLDQHVGALREFKEAVG